MDMQTQFEKESNECLINTVKPQIRKLAGYVSPPQGEFIAKLNQNENPYDLPDSLKEDILMEMKKISWSRYPMYDPLQLRKKLAQRFDLKPDQILPANGSNQLLYAVATGLISQNDNIIVSSPSFSLFYLVTKIFQGNLIRISRNPDFSHDQETLLKNAETAKLTFLCSPDNPTGIAMDLESLIEILERTKGLVFWDEAYGEFWGKNAIYLLKKYPNLIISRTFSKAFSLAGLRIGYIMADPALIAEIRKVNVPYNLNLFSTLIAIRILEESRLIESQVEKIISERKWLIEKMQNIEGITPYPSEANFILFRTPDSEKMFQRLLDERVLVREVEDHPLLKNCLRVTVGTPVENKAFIEALTKHI